MSTKEVKKDGMGILLRVLIVLAVTLCVLLVVLRYDEIRDNGLFQTFFPTIVTEETAVRAEVLEFSADADNVFHAYKNRLVILSPSGVEVLDDHGEHTNNLAKNFGRPTITANGGYMIAYDAGGKNMLYMKENGEILDISGELTVLHASINAKGSYLLVTDESGAKTTATLFDSQRAEQFKWYSSERYITMGDIAPTGDRIVFAGVKQQNARIVSSVVLFSASGDEPIGTWEILDELVIGLYYLNDKRILALCENEAVFLDGKTCAEIGSFSYQGMALSSCSVGSDFVALRLTGAGVGEVSNLLTLDFDGATIAQLDVSGVISMSAGDSAIGVLTTDSLLVYTKTLDKEAEGSSVGGARLIVMRPGKEALIFTSNTANIYEY